MSKTIGNSAAANTPRSHFCDVKYRATAGNAFHILTASNGMIRPSVRCGGKHICEIIVYKSEIGLPGMGRQKLRLKPDAFGIRATHGLYEKDIIVFYTKDGREYVGEITLGFNGAWYVKTPDDIFRFNEIASFRYIGTTLTRKTLQEYISDHTSRPADSDVSKTENVPESASETVCRNAGAASAKGLTAAPEKAKLDYAIYTDGSAVGSNPGPAGFGYLIVSNGKRVRESSESIGISTSNAAEYLGIIHGIKDALKDSPSGITVYTDSKYIVDSVNCWAEGWEKNSWRKRDGSRVRNLEYLRELLDLVRRHNIVLQHIKGHNGDLFNERCDFLANNAAKRNLI